jgi:hypothetical protein
MLTLKVETDLALSEPNLEFGLITRWAITVCESDATRSRSIGSAQFALIHCASALNLRVPICDVLDEDSADLSALYPVFFEKNSLKERYQGGAGMDIIYVEALELQPEARARNVEQAIVRRVFDTFGASCAIGVMDLLAPEDLTRWETLGFELVEEAETMSGDSQFLVMDLARVHPRVFEVEGQENAFVLVDGPDGEDDEDDDDNDDNDDDDDEDEDDDDGPAHGHA